MYLVKIFIIKDIINFMFIDHILDQFKDIKNNKIKLIVVYKNETVF